MIPQRVSLITIGAWNIPNLRAFYKGLSWKETDWSTDEYAVFQTVGTMLSIWSIDHLCQESGMTKPDSFDYFRGVTLSINVDQRVQVDEVMEAASKAGARITKQPHDAFWGGRGGGFLDPENNCWEVAYNPNSKFDDRGAMIEMNG
jgi:uncharacterized glyoxalase superfamily protein PhnB